jgi:hypothetical protein
LDGNGNVFVTGDSRGTGSGRDYATIMYSSAGVPLWTNRYSGPAFAGYAGDVATSLAVDSSGNVIVTGASDRLGDSDFPYFDFATIKYSNAGVPLWTNLYISPGYDNAYANALAVDSSGNVFVTGYLERYASYARDIATVAYSSAGAPLWTNRHDGPGHWDDEALSIALDNNGNVFVAGDSYGTNNNSDFVTLAYSGAGAPLWTNRFRGPVDDYDAAMAVAVNGSGNVLVTGWSRTTTNGTDFVTIKYSSLSPPPVPSLAIRRTTTNTVVISWASPSTGFVLQQNTNQLGSVTWINVNGAVQDNGTNRSMIANPSAGSRFYRLFKP